MTKSGRLPDSGPRGPKEPKGLFGGTVHGEGLSLDEVATFVERALADNPYPPAALESALPGISDKNRATIPS